MNKNRNKQQENFSKQKQKQQTSSYAVLAQSSRARTRDSKIINSSCVGGFSRTFQSAQAQRRVRSCAVKRHLPQMTTEGGEPPSAPLGEEEDVAVRPNTLSCVSITEYAL